MREFRPGALLILLVAAPIIGGMLYSIGGAVGWTGIGAGSPEGPSRIIRVLGERLVWRSTAWTLWIATAATFLASVAAVATAAAFRGGDPASRMVRAVASLPLPVPHVVAGLAALLILGQSGLLARVLHAAGLIEVPTQMPVLVFDPFGIGLILALAWKEFAFLFIVAWSVLPDRGQPLDEAARTLGAGPFRTFVFVTLPVLTRAMLPAIVAVFAFVLGSYEAAALLAPSDPLPLSVLTMERYYDADVSRRADAYVLALLGFMLAVLAVIVHERARSRWGSLR